MPFITDDFYPQYFKTRNTGGRALPMADGYLRLGIKNLDPKVYANQVQVYYLNENGDKTPIKQPIRLNDTGIPVHNGQCFTPFIDENSYSISVSDVNDIEDLINLTAGESGTDNLLNYACIAFNLPTSAAGTLVRYMELNMQLDNVFGLVAPDNSLWINPGLEGTLTHWESPFYGLIQVDASLKSLIKKRSENVYCDYYPYRVNTVVIATNNVRYVCLKDNGPDAAKGVVNPIQPNGSDTDPTVWKKYNEAYTTSTVLNRDFAKKVGTYPKLRAQATTKADVGLSAVVNAGLSNSISSTATNVGATSRAAYDAARSSISVPTAYNGIRTYVLAKTTSTTSPGSTVPGSALRGATAAGTTAGSALGGTWRAMGYAISNAGIGADRTTLFVRIS